MSSLMALDFFGAIYHSLERQLRQHQARMPHSSAVGMSIETFHDRLRQVLCAAGVPHSSSVRISATIAAGQHLFPFRTEQLSPPAPMVLRWRRRGRVEFIPLRRDRRRECRSGQLPLGGCLFYEDGQWA